LGNGVSGRYTGAVRFGRIFPSYHFNAATPSAPHVSLSLVKPLWWLFLVLPLLGADRRTIRGVVVDEQEKPIVGACLDHYGAIYCNTRTDALGRFQIDTAASAMVVRKPRYAPQRVSISGDALRIVLVSDNAAAPVCQRRCDDGIHGQFCFPYQEGVKATRPFNDVDYTARSYIARAGRERAGIMHGQGPSWSLGLPRARDVWESREYSERDYVWGPELIVVDARGKSADGTAWRYLGTLGESASYSGVKSDVLVQVLDRVLDGFCMASR
jgi:hypothetical protein